MAKKNLKIPNLKGGNICPTYYNIKEFMGKRTKSSKVKSKMV
jgi:hypothetical protein